MTVTSGPTHGSHSTMPLAPVVPGPEARARQHGHGEQNGRADLHELVESLAERTLRPSDDSQAASRILVAANTAAEQLLSDARAEAMALVDNAKARTAELLTVAQELADRELHAERTRVAGAVATWNAQQREIAVRLDTLRTSLATYQADAEATLAAITEALAGLAAVDIDAGAARATATVGHDLDAEPVPETAAPADLPAPAEVEGRVVATPLPAASTPAAPTPADPTAPAEERDGPHAHAHVPAHARDHADTTSDVGAQRTSLFLSPAATATPSTEPAATRQGLFGR